MQSAEDQSHETKLKKKTIKLTFARNTPPREFQRLI